MSVSKDPNLPKLQEVGSKISRIAPQPIGWLHGAPVISGTPTAPNLCSCSTSQEGFGPTSAQCPGPLKDLARQRLTRQQPGADGG